MTPRVGLVLALGLSLVGASAAACGRHGPIALRYSLWAQPGEAQYEAALAFKAALESRSAGAFEVSVYPGNQLGTSPEELEQLALNAIQIFVSGWAGVDEIEYLSLPYLMRSLDDYVGVIEGPIGRDWNERLVAQSGVRLIGFLARSARQISANRVITSMADLSGLKLRVPERDYYVQTFVAFGAKPTPMSFSETYTSLQTGVVDGQENPVETIYAQKFYEVQKSIAIIDYIKKPAYVMVSERFWQARSEKEREWILEAQRASEVLLRDLLPAQERDLLEKMAHAGVIVTYPDTQPFVDATQSVRDRIGTRVWGEQIYRQIAQIGRGGIENRADGPSRDAGAAMPPP